jgi:hypothetical protein
MRHVSLLLLLGLLLSGCGLELPSTEEPTPQVLFIALDGTASYEHLTEAKKATIRALEQAPSKSTVYVRWITGNSAADTAAIASARIPESASNPYQSGDKERPIKKRLARAIAEAKFPEAGQTDLAGLLWAAEQRFKNHPKLSPRLILATDLAGNAGRDFPDVNLSGVSVQILGFEVDPAEPERESRWRDTFHQAGADTVRVHYLDEPFAKTN